MRSRVVQRVAAIFAGAFAVAGLVAGAAPSGSPEEMQLVAFADPKPEILHALAARADVDVRWVEPGLVLCETMQPSALPPAWGGRVVAARSADLVLGLLRAPEIEALSKPEAAPGAVQAFAAAARVATLGADRGPVWVLLASPGAWPSELLGCHGGLVLPAHRVDPRSLLATGPPAELRRFLADRDRPWTAGERRALAGISAESLQVNLRRLAHDEFGNPADRYVFHQALDALHVERIRQAMLTSIAGVAGATVERQGFPMRRSATDTVTAYNLVARIPGSVPGTGTFVVCGHVDATGSRDSRWTQDIRDGLPVVTPGAEDNASGVACVLELLRAVAEARRAATVDFAFDLEFIAFSGEEVPTPLGPEQGLVGSESYVRDRTAAGTKLLAAFNFDMVGYDSLPGRPGNLQIVHNPASLWLAELLRDASTTLVPPTTLDLVLEPDASRSSDHNSFWNVNAAAILAADAPITLLRRYQSYHRPIDTLDRVDVPKLVEVSRVVLAGLLRFDAASQTSPQLLFTAEDLELLRTVNGQDVVYSPSFHRLYPGAPLKARLQVHGLGSRYQGAVRMELETRAAGATTGAMFFDSTATVDLPTGGRLDLLRSVAIGGADLGWRTLTARVTYDSGGGSPVVQTQQDSFFVDVNQQSDLAVEIRPNPTRTTLDQTRLHFDLRIAGELQVDIYSLEGERVSSSTRPVSPPALSTRFSIPIVPAGTPAAGATDLASGAYIVRVLFRGVTGETTSATATLAVLR